VDLLSHQEAWCSQELPLLHPLLLLLLHQLVMLLLLLLLLLLLVCRRATALGGQSASAHSHSTTTTACHNPRPHSPTTNASTTHMVPGGASGVAPRDVQVVRASLSAGLPLRGATPASGSAGRAIGVGGVLARGACMHAKGGIRTSPVAGRAAQP
jgi:hypothetical protein